MLFFIGVQRASPTPAQTQAHIGVGNRIGVPNLLDAVLGRDAGAISRSFIADWITLPRPWESIESFSQLLECLISSYDPIPKTQEAELQHEKVLKYLEVASKKMTTEVETIHRVRRMIGVALRILEEGRYQEMKEALLTIVNNEHSMKNDEKTLVTELKHADLLFFPCRFLQCDVSQAKQMSTRCLPNSCSSLKTTIDDCIPESITPHASLADEEIPDLQDFLEANEAEFKGRVRLDSERKSVEDVKRCVMVHSHNHKQVIYLKNISMMLLLLCMCHINRASNKVRLAAIELRDELKFAFEIDQKPHLGKELLRHDEAVNMIITTRKLASKRCIRYMRK